MATEESPHQRKFSKYNKHTVNSIRNEIRTEFKRRLQLQREKQRDSQRNLSEEKLRTLVEESSEDIKNMVLSDGGDDINFMLNLITEIEQEMLLIDENNSDYGTEYELELNNLVYDKCLVCEELMEATTPSNMCEKCTINFINTKIG